MPWSLGINDDDKALNDASQFYGKRVIMSIKKDGENTSAYSDGHVHARSIDSRGGEDRAWVKQFLANNVCFNLPDGWRICGENMWAKHSIHYENLPSYFLGFSLWNEHNICISWDETLEYFSLLGITHVEVLYDGIWHEDTVRTIEKTIDPNKEEGYVIRIADAFQYSQFKNSIAKYVRRDHVKTTKHWRTRRVSVPNELSK